MAHQEQNQKYSSSSGAGCGGGSGASGGHGGTGHNCDKKLKQMKVPQRGLGIAQLEKIRLQEEQLRNHAASLQTPFLLPPPNLVLFPGGSNSMSDSAATGREMGWPCSGSVCGNWPTLWNDQYNLAGHIQNLDYGGSAIQSNISNLHCETKTPWPFPQNLHRAEQSQHPFPSPMADTSKASMLNFQLEPPSSQNYFGNNCTALRPEEERMVGMKRLYPFSVDDAPGPSLNFTCPSACASFIPRRDEIASCTNHGSSTTNPANTLMSLREFPVNSNAMSDQKKKKVKEFGDFLTLAPPTVDLPCLEVPDFDALPYQEVIDNPVKSPEMDPPIQHTFHNFLPPASTQNGDDNGNDEKAEVLDLSLKL